MDKNIEAQIEAQLVAAEGRLPMLQPAQALALVRVAAVVRGAQREGRLIVSSDGMTPEDVAEVEAAFGADMETLNSFIVDMQIGSAQAMNWSEL